MKSSGSKVSTWRDMIVKHVHWWLCDLRMMCYLKSCSSTWPLEKWGIFISLLTYWSYISFICFLSKWVYPCVFCWTVMIVSLDTGVDYDVASKNHVFHNWCGLGDELKSKIQPFVIYLCFVLLEINLGFIYLHRFILYLFHEWDPNWILFGDLFVMFWWCSSLKYMHLYVLWLWGLFLDDVYMTYLYVWKKKVFAFSLIKLI